MLVVVGRTMVFPVFISGTSIGVSQAIIGSSTFTYDVDNRLLCRSTHDKK